MIKIISNHIRRTKERKIKRMMTKAIEAIRRIDRALIRLNYSRQRRKTFWKGVIKSQDGRDKLIDLMDAIRKDLK